MDSVGKQVGTRLYVSTDQIESLDTRTHELVARARAIADLTASYPFNVLRIDVSNEDVAFLYYPNLGRVPFPSLDLSCRVNVRAQLVTSRRYGNSLNPPVLHRTELLLPHGHPARAPCMALTAVCEAVGLFTNPAAIGFKRQWEELVAEHGYAIADFELVPIGNAVGPADGLNTRLTEAEVVERHLTALARTTLSAPVQGVLRDRLLLGTSSFFDYGCGRGDDIATLQAAGFCASGWDPHYRPDDARVLADVVNIGFVINVIENKAERIAALEGAYALTRKVLSVATMLGSNEPSRGRPFADGVLTSRNTFQKYFSQGELRTFIESVLDEEAYAAAPGVFYVFRDRELEQRYLLTKSSNPSRMQRLMAHTIQHVRNVSADQTTTGIDHTSARSPSTGRSRSAALAGKVVDSAQVQEFQADLWRLLLELGRVPHVEEVSNAQALKEHFGSLKRAVDWCLKVHDLIAFRQAEKVRRDDILVMLALRMFDRRRQFGKLESRLAKDIRAFFGSLGRAEAQATELLFSIQNADAIQAACDEAAIDGLGWLEKSESLQLHSSLVSRLPPILRVYVGCATVMAGDLANFDLVKAHIRSGKVSLMRHDNFNGKPLPLLQRRVKVSLRDQDVDIFDYDQSHPPTVLFRKSRYINEEFPSYAEQVLFEESLELLRLFDLDGYGPQDSDFRSALSARRYEVDGFDLVRSSDVPDLDQQCGANYRFRDLIECGETWTRKRPENTPASAPTYNALRDLSAQILDPVIEYFGAIELTYGFSSPSLAKHIARRIAPELDQHAACEVARSGRLVCSRGGAAVDFLVRDEDMSEVARWVAENCRFDRIYFYGSDRPLHVSIGPQNTGAIYRMVEGGSRRIPRRVNAVDLGLRPAIERSDIPSSR